MAETTNEHAAKHGAPPPVPLTKKVIASLDASRERSISGTAKPLSTKDHGQEPFDLRK